MVRITKREETIRQTKKHGTIVGSDKFRDLRHLPENVQLQICTTLVNGVIDTKELENVSRRRRVLGIIRASFHKLVDPDGKQYESWANVVEDFPYSTRDENLIQYFDSFRVCYFIILSFSNLCN